MTSRDIKVGSNGSILVTSNLVCTVLAILATIIISISAYLSLDTPVGQREVSATTTLDVKMQ